MAALDSFPGFHCTINYKIEWRFLINELMVKMSYVRLVL